MKLDKLNSIQGPTPITALTEGLDGPLAELQKALSHLGYPVGDIDGEIGPRTRNAWAEFKTDVFQGNPTLIGPGSVNTLQEKLNKFSLENNHDFSTKEGTIAAIKSECRAQGIGLETQIAYVLATVEWETAQTFQPVREAFWLSEDWRMNNLRYFPYYGRGYVQLTWKTNYQKYSNILDIDLVNKPDLAMEPKASAFTLVHGFKTGSFTGRNILEFINQSKTDYFNARRCINFTDHAGDIARLAKEYFQNQSIRNL